MTRSGAGADDWRTREGKCARAGPGQALRVGEPATSHPDGVGDRPTLADRPEQPTLSGTRRLRRAGRPHGPTEAQGGRPAPAPRPTIRDPGTKSVAHLVRPRATPAQDTAGRWPGPHGLAGNGDAALRAQSVTTPASPVWLTTCLRGPGRGRPLLTLRSARSRTV